MNTTALNANITDVENKIPDVGRLVTTNVLNTKVSEVANKILDNSKYIATQKYNKLTAKKFGARLKQADLVNKLLFIIN